MEGLTARRETIVNMFLIKQNLERNWIKVILIYQFVIVRLFFPEFQLEAAFELEYFCINWLSHSGYEWI